MLDYRANYQGNPGLMHRNAGMMQPHYGQQANGGLGGMLRNPNTGTIVMIVGGVVLLGGLGYLAYTLATRPKTTATAGAAANDASTNPFRQRNAYVRRVA